MRNEQSQGYIKVFIAGLLWGTIGIWATLLGRMGMGSMMTAFFRLLTATVLLFFILIVKGKGFRLFKISKKGLISCILIGFLSQALYNYFYMYAVQTTGMSVAAVLLYTSPIFVAILSRMILKENMTKNKIIAIAVNIVGCVLTVTGGSFAGANINMTGIIMGVLAGFTYGLMPILSRIGADDEEAYTSSFYGLAFGALLLFFMAHPYTGVDFEFTPQMILVLIGFGLIPSALGYIVYFGGLGQITETSKVPVFCSVENVAAAAFGFIIFHESFTALKVIGIALVFCSIVIMNTKNKASSAQNQ
ncbi:MAG: EamA family transporter [Clostridiales bacterium]|nr:EamA family transporter [Candidatus Crickella merdequi]